MDYSYIKARQVETGINMIKARLARLEVDLANRTIKPQDYEKRKAELERMLP